MIQLELHNDLVIVLTTESNHEKASKLASKLLKSGLVACVSLFDVFSHYIWESKEEKSKEVQLIIKTSKSKVNELLDTIKELHSYQTPELICLEASAEEDYMKWINGIISNSDS